MSKSKPILTTREQIAFTDDYRGVALQFRQWFEQIEQLYPVYSQLIKLDVESIIQRLQFMEFKARFPERYINQYNNLHYETEHNSNFFRTKYPYRK